MFRWGIPIRSWPWLGAVVLAVGLLGCGGGGGGDGGDATATLPSGASGRVAVLLTDGPAGYDEVNVWIQTIELLSDAGKAVVFQSGEPAGEKRNLLDLANETELFSVQDGVPARRYDKIRLQVSKAELVRYGGDGQAPEIVVPKVPGRGKIDLNPRQPFTVVPGETLIVRLDLDAQKSIHIVEDGQRVLFRPVVFVDVLREMVPGNLVRIRGTVEQKGEGSFLLCPQGVSATTFADYPSFLNACVDVQVSDQTAIFDPGGSVIPFTDLAVADMVEAVGRFGPEPPDSDWSHLATFHAVVVEVGTYLKLKGTVLGVPEVQGGLVIFPFAVDPGQGVLGTLDVQAVLESGTKFFDEDGTPVEVGSLREGTRAVIDGVLSGSVLKAALVIVEAASTPDGEVEGVVAGVSPADRKVTLEGGDCAVMTSTARFFLMEQASVGDPVEMTPVGLDTVAPGQQVRLFGSGSVDGCLEADTGFVLQLAE